MPTLGNQLYKGKCSRCEHVKEDFELEPKPYDVLLCSQCTYKVALREENRLLINKRINELSSMLEKLKDWINEVF